MYAIMERIPRKNHHAVFVLVDLFFKRSNAEIQMRNMYDSMTDLHDYYIKEIEPGDQYNDAAEKLDRIVHAIGNILYPLHKRTLENFNNVFTPLYDEKSEQGGRETPYSEMVRRWEEQDEKLGIPKHTYERNGGLLR